ncbi:MAG: HD domain-containing protein [Dehalococcoidia bacterium]
MTMPAELREALSDPQSGEALRTLDDRGILTAWFPALEDGRGFKQPELHHYTVLDHCLAAVRAMDDLIGNGDTGRLLRAEISWLDLDETLQGDVGGVPVRQLLRLSALVHDIAKPETATIVEGRLRFPRHGPRGGEMVAERLPELGFGEVATDFVRRMVRYHLRPGELIRNWPPTDRAIRRFVTDLDGHVLALLLVQMADGWATRGPNYTREHFRRHCGFASYVLARAWAVTDPGEPPLITGEDLMHDLDLPGGRLLGAVLTSVRDAQLNGSIRERADALALAQAILARMRDETASSG